MRLHLVAAAALVATLAGCATAPPQQTAGAKPKNIIFFLGDGMGINTLTAARIYAVGEEGQLTLDTLPESAFVKTFSNDAQVTDSAASMTAYMTGVKANNGVISMGAVTLAELAKQRGMSAGLVTSTRVTDATPAATYAHVPKRELEGEIAASLVPGGAGYNAALGATGLDVVLGGGVDAFAKRSDGRNLLAELRAKGYRMPANTAELKALDERAAQPVIGLFAPANMSFSAMRDAAKEPSLTEMTSKAIGILSKNPNGFFLMVEGGLIDLALHSTNAKRALQETVAFDQALKAAITQMQAIDPGLRNTLIVATADHDHTLLLNGYAKRTGPTTATQPGVLGLLKQVSDGKPRRDLDGAPMTIIGFGTGENRVKGSRASQAGLTDEIVSADDYHQEAVVRMEPGNETHGGTDVYLGAIGAGAERFHGTIDNTHVFNVIKAAAGW